MRSLHDEVHIQRQFTNLPPCEGSTAHCNFTDWKVCYDNAEVMLPGRRDLIGVTANSP